MKKPFLLIAIVVALFACKKDKSNDTPEPITQALGMPLGVGNYWVYQAYHIDSAGVESSNGELDSLYISGTQSIGGETYYTLIGSNYFFYENVTPDIVFLRDSLGYIINEMGKIFFSQNNYTDTLETVTDTSLGAINRYTYMAWQDSSFTVPAGTFNNTGTLLTSAIPNDPNYPWGSPRFAYRTYANNIGLIKRRFFYSAIPDYGEYRLIRYHIN